MAAGKVNGKLVGQAKGGGFGFRVNKPLALGLVNATSAKIGTELNLDILSKRHRAQVIGESPFDAKNDRLRCND